MSKIADFFRRTGTPFTAGLFFVSTISGVALYFGIASRLFHEMHEVLSMVLLVPFAVHLWRNWKSLVAYFRKAWMPVALALSVAAGGFFAYGASAGPGRGNPAFALMNAAATTPIASLAPVLRLDEDVAIRRLTDAGFKPTSAADTVAAIAARNGRETGEVMARLVAPRS